jgi:hypothetical protein
LIIDSLFIYLIKNKKRRFFRLWNARWKKTILIVTVHMNPVAEKTSVVIAFIITDKIMNFPHVFLIKKRKEHTTVQYVTLLKNDKTRWTYASRNFKNQITSYK